MAKTASNAATNASQRKDNDFGSPSPGCRKNSRDGGKIQTAKSGQARPGKNKKNTLRRERSSQAQKENTIPSKTR
jgi:hypothetical protein